MSHTNVSSLHVLTNTTLGNSNLPANLLKGVCTCVCTYREGSNLRNKEVVSHPVESSARLNVIQLKKI